MQEADSRVNINAEVPGEVHERLSTYRRRRGRTWAGVLIDAAEELPEGGL